MDTARPCPHDIAEPGEEPCIGPLDHEGALSSVVVLARKITKPGERSLERAVPGD